MAGARTCVSSGCHCWSPAPLSTPCSPSCTYPNHLPSILHAHEKSLSVGGEPVQALGARVRFILGDGSRWEPRVLPVLSLRSQGTLCHHSEYQLSHPPRYLLQSTDPTTSQCWPGPASMPPLPQALSEVLIFFLTFCSLQERSPKTVWRQ